ncbi:mycothiol synthase [Nocardia cyriacigeorgica]|uniref:Mycothiol acetyltransferase n=1 Tax=Nocardia cyriacigeorgica TaxID=135487 RepID=A0A6P1DDT3_9NOCA|nr:mycothiol synthase [Nocardia cyriacigeorgica]NEW38837.1 mycothiol synthase [Nocardia cyriacigeorgica]NEW46562.1 mycothiol synthase [Nocardia cyriacigeorgica]NEW53602.1 mycothiol synthase [Nocardia cyriacigeorgica]NEW58221.1 mycothiol synthase [Nocardia cyriacigeorgica]
MSDMTLRWSDELDAGIAEQVRATLDRAVETDGVAAISEQAVLSLREADAARHLVGLREGAVIGYANLVSAHGDHPAMAEVVVDPAVRGNGYGAELVAEALAAGGAGARVWAHGNLPAARAVSARLGLTIARELWQMRRDLATEELPELAVPEGVQLRTYAGADDDAELLRVNNAAFAWHPEQGGWTDRDIAVRHDEPWFDPKGLFLAVDPADPDRLLGFHWTKVHAELDPPLGEVYVVGIDPAAQGRGLGGLLTLAGLHYLRDRGLGAVLLYTEADNESAVRTYTRLGFTVAHVDAAYTAAGHAS